MFFTFLLFHPLDNGPFIEIDLSKINPLISRNNVIVSPINGKVEELIFKNNKFTIKISNDDIEIIIPDLHKVYKDIGDNINIGDEIGEDNNITLFTKFAIIQYNNATEFPQFYNNKLRFYNNVTGTPIYSMRAGFVSLAQFEHERGFFYEITNIEDPKLISQIQYWHMLSLSMLRLNDKVSNNMIIGFIGNTGLSIEPHLTVFFANSYYDFKAIYIKNKI